MQDRFASHSNNEYLVNRLFSGKGELASLCREKDWSDTLLGPVDSWSASLRAVAALVVASPLPMIVLWGPDLAQIYNDGYRRVMGKKHPAGLGQCTRQCWPEVWEFNAPLYDGVINRCETFTFKNQPFVIERHGHPEKAFFTLSYSPVFEDQGAVGGVLVTVSETTAAVERERVMEIATESEERLRVALEAADLGTWDLDLTNDTAAVRSLRHDQIFGYEQHQAEWGQEIATRHVLPEDRHIFQDAFLRAAKTGVLSCEVRVRWPDGGIHWIAPLGRTYYDDDGRPVRMTGVVADVTERNRIEALQQSEERFRLMADAAPQIVWVTDPDGRVEFFNQQWSDYTGLTYNPKTAAEVASAVIHPDDVAITVQQFEQARSSGATFLVEHRIRSAAGEYRWFLVRANPYCDPGTGRISRWFGASVDIHDRKVSEETLSLHTARQTFQLELADRIRPLVDPDEVVAAACELLGRHLGVARVMYAEADEAGETVNIKPGWNDGTVASIEGAVLRMDDFGPSIGHALRAGESLVVADVTTDQRSASYAGLYGEWGVRSFVALTLMKAGRLRAVLNLHDSRPHDWTEHEIALAQDMADRTWSAAERALVQAELRIEHERTQAVFDNMTEGFLLLDKDWTVVQMNAAGLRISQRSAAEAIGRNHWDVWPEAIGTEGERFYRSVKETSVTGTLQYRQTFVTGVTRWIESTVYPTLDEGIAVLFRDITGQKQAEENLLDAARRKDEFLAMLAHELRNPLAPIGAAAELLQMAKLDDARVRKTSQIIGRQVTHMTSLVDDLLDVSRVTRGLVELNKATLDMRHVVTEAIEQVAPLIQSRRHHLALHLAPETTMVSGDKKRLVQVIANILNNAAKYTHEGGNIILKTELLGSHVLIEVADNGIGMAPELVSRAFDLFSQASRKSDRSSGGLGLGLALVKSLTELHFGKVMCESAGSGKGSKFIVCLPRLPVESQHSETGYKNSGMPKETPPLRIMVVDDNVDAASMLAMLLQGSGHDVLVEHGSRSALECARKEAPQVCLLDIGLPEIDGNELAQRLRAQPETAKSLLIAVTGYGQENDRKQTMAAGFDHHLVKPVDTKKLASILAAMSRQ